MTDEKLIMSRRCLEMCSTCAYMCNQNLYLLIIFRLVRETIAHGLNKSSVDGYASFSLILFAIFGDMKRGGEMIKAAELFLDRDIIGMKQPSGVVFTIKSFYESNTKPLQGSMQPLLQSYLYSLQHGDVETGCWTLTFRSCNLWFTGRPLNDLLNEFKASAGVQDQMHQAASRMCLLPYLQAVVNLCGDVPKPWILSGEVMDFEEMSKLAKKEKNDMLRVYITLTQLELFVIFQDWHAAKMLLISAGDLRTLAPGSFHGIRFTFIEGLVSLKAAQSSGSLLTKKRWRAKAKKNIRRMKAWLKKGNVNVVHNVHVLTAEYHVLNGCSVEAEESFKEASAAASRSGFMHDKALSLELAGQYYMAKGDDYWASYNMDLAHQSYLDWHAKSKAENLGNKYPQYLADKGF